MAKLKPNSFADVLSAADIIELRYVQPNRVQAELTTRKRFVAGTAMRTIAVGPTIREALVSLWTIVQEGNISDRPQENQP